MTKLLIFLAVISTCSAGIIPKDFRANEHVLHSKSEISDDDDWDNCFKKVRFEPLTSVPTRRVRKDEKRDSGTIDHHQNQLTEKFQNSVHEINGGELKKAAFAESFVVYADSNKHQRSLKAEFGINTNELKTTENSLSEIFSSHFDSPKESKLRDSKENKLDQQTEKFQIPLQNTGVGEDDKIEFSNSFVEYANANKNQRSLKNKIQKQNISELEIGENLSKVLVANGDTSVDYKLTHFKDNLNQSTEELKTFLQRTGDGVLNKTEVFTESFVEYERSNKTKESLAEFQMPKIKEIETVVNFGETVPSFNISDNSKMEVQDINTDSSEVNLTDTEESSVFDLIASAINASDIFEYLNLTDSLSFDVVTENTSSGFLDVDETELMSEGSEIALFQDDSTTGFEFLIDSETTKNLILTELLRSENFVVTENGKIGFLELPDIFSEIIELNELDTGKDDLMEIVETNNLEIPVDGTLDQIGALNVATEIEVENRTVMNISVISATVSAEEAPVSTNLTSLTEFEEHPKVTGETNFSDDVIASSPDSSKTCPAPGICFLWFFAQVKCSDSSECRGSSICCKMGCSKLCVDV